MSDKPDEMQRPSVLRRLKEKTGSKLDLHLHVHDGRDEESDVPVKIDDEAKALRDPSGRYQVLGEIGRGGVGVVYKGRDQDLGRDVALKVLRPEHVNRPEIVERFIEEAQIGGQLQHPGIVPVYEIGLQAGERPYFAMKLVKGHTLAELLALRKRPDEERRRFLGIFEQICQTVAYAHARRVVHRDLKPQNVMLGSFGEVQVVDWGFAKVLPKSPLANAEGAAPPKAPTHLSVIATVRSDPKKGSHSVVGSMMGTPAYMPLEQALGDVDHMDQRSDVFGLGAILCEILTGQPPYLASSGDLIHQAARAELQGAYERLERSGADAVLITLCRQCLAPAREARPDSAGQVAAAVAQYLSSIEERARQARIHAAEAKVRARSTLQLSAAAVLVLALAGGGYLYMQREAQTRRDQANRRVATALNEANVRLGEARSKEPPDLALWARAADAATQAKELAGETDVASEQRVHVDELSETVHDDYAAAVAAAAQLDRDAAMQQRLLDVRTQRLDEHGADFNEKENRRREVGYAAAFGEYLGGRDLTTMRKEEALPALSQRIAVDLASGLDSWCRSRRYLAGKNVNPLPDPEVTSRLSDLASAIDPDPWRNRLRIAMAAKERDREAIVALYDDAKREDADLESLPLASMFLLGSALYEVGEVALSQAVHERAIERFPTDFASVYVLALLHLHAKRFAAAEGYFRIAHALQPDRLENLHCLGKALDGLGNKQEEERVFRRLVELQPEEAHWRWQLGRVLSSQGRLDEAVASCQRGIELAPDEPWSYNGMSVALAWMGRLDESIAFARRAIEVDPQNAEAYDHLGNSLADQGRFDEAIASFQRAIELDPKSTRFLYNLGQTLQDFRKLDDAVASFRRALELDPNDASCHDALGNVLRQQRKLDEAIASGRRAVELDPKAPGSHYNLALALSVQSQWDESVASYRRAIELEPNDARFHNNLGKVLENRGDLDEALASFRRAASIWSRQRDAYAIEWLPKARSSVAGLEARIERRNRLLAVLRGESESQDAAELCDAGNLGLERRELRLAVRAYRLSIELEPATAHFHFNLGLAFERMNRLDDAIASYERAIELDGNDANFHGSLARALLKQGELEDAVACYRKSLELDSKNPARWMQLSDALRQIGETDEAIACAREAVERMRADLALLAKRMESGRPEDPPLVRHTLRAWQETPDLISLRDPAALARLPVEDREAIERLWADVAALLRK